MHLRRVVLLLLAIAAVVFLTAPARAGGWDSLTFPRSHYVVGEVASGRSEFFAGELKGTGSLDGGPYYAYLLLESRDKLFGFIKPPTIPESAILLDVLQVEGPIVHDDGRYGVASLTFTVPDVPTGDYSIGFCDDPCAHSTVGWLAWGSITVVHTPYEGTLLRRLDQLHSQQRSLSRDVRKAEGKIEELRTRVGNLREVAKNGEGPAEPSIASSPVQPSTPREPSVTWWIALVFGAVGIALGVAVGRHGRPPAPEVAALPEARGLPSDVGSGEGPEDLGREGRGLSRGAGVELEDEIGETADVLGAALLVEHEDGGIRSGLLQSPEPVSRRVELDLADEELNLFRDRPVASLTRALRLEPGHECRIPFGVGLARVPRLRESGRDLERTVAPSADCDRGKIDVLVSERGASQAQIRIGDCFPPPQRRKGPATRFETTQAIVQPRKRDPGCRMVEAGEVIRARAQSDLEPPAAGGLSDRELSGEEEGVAKRDVQHVNGEPDPCRPTGHGY
jgi:hypothetical protein